MLSRYASVGSDSASVGRDSVSVGSDSASVGSDSVSVGRDSVGRERLRRWGATLRNGNAFFCVPRVYPQNALRALSLPFYDQS